MADASNIVGNLPAQSPPLPSPSQSPAQAPGESAAPAVDSRKQRIPRIPPSIDEIRAALASVINRILAPFKPPAANDPIAINEQLDAMDRPLSAADRPKMLPLLTWLSLCGARPPWVNEILTACNQLTIMRDMDSPRSDSVDLLTMLQDIKECVETAKLTLPSGPIAAHLIAFVNRENAAMRTKGLHRFLEINAAASGPRQHRVNVDLERRTVTLDGRTFEVSSEQALRWVKVLADRPGEWIAGKDLEAFDTELMGVRTSGLRKYLPNEVDSLIEAKTGAGSRLKAG